MGGSFVAGTLYLCPCGGGSDGSRGRSVDCTVQTNGVRDAATRGTTSHPRIAEAGKEFTGVVLPALLSSGV